MASWYGTSRNPAGADSSRCSAVTSRSGCDPWRYRFTPFGQSMPRLNGNSSHGSNPITWLFLTFSWMPHCWPQKQQCVRTRLSGSAVVDSRSPVMTARCGPKRSVIFTSSTGRVAIGTCAVCQRVLPQRALCKTKQRAAAARADLLIVCCAIIAVHLVAEAELLFGDDEVFHHLG